MSNRQPSRRQLFIGVGVMAAAATVPSVLAANAHASVNPASHPRKDIDDLTPMEIARYEHAVAMLQYRVMSNPATMALYPALQAPTSPDATLTDLVRGRTHLTTIESLLRAADPALTSDISVPYWDFTRPPSGRNWPAAFERGGSPLFAGAGQDGIPNLGPVFWSYHAYIDTVWQRWERDNGSLPPGMTAHLWIGSGIAEIRAARDPSTA